MIVIKAYNYNVNTFSLWVVLQRQNLTYKVHTRTENVKYW